MPTSDVTPRGLSTASYIDKDGVILGGDILIIRPKKEFLYGLFLSYYIYAHKSEVIRLVTGSTVFHIYGSDMKKFKLQIPSTEEQQAIASILTTSDKEITLLEQKLHALEQQKKFLLNNLVTGDIRTPEDLLQERVCKIG